MGLSKKELFNSEENVIAKYAKAFAHPARIAILKYLIKTNACVCGDLVDKLPLSQSTVSQHLKELKKVGLIQGNIEGVKICYCINNEEWQLAKKHFDTLFDAVSKMNTCCS